MRSINIPVLAVLRMAKRTRESTAVLPKMPKPIFSAISNADITNEPRLEYLTVQVDSCHLLTMAADAQHTSLPTLCCIQGHVHVPGHRSNVRIIFACQSATLYIIIATKCWINLLLIRVTVCGLPLRCYDGIHFTFSAWSAFPSRSMPRQSRRGNVHAGCQAVARLHPGLDMRG